ncbi:hypothetical protein Kpol_1058p16 [Vanderwaltozyma polyspora DSM 70294]|uniref:Uncharacterized protein n=1 Tax=Vanderwaltozyma polyspora (strain ATCC 22028 / DSM 70294 / BCRC 21397 / CBS 2163 / NBRC 10782 / NRRL Y-8283 / UCD 57-17) TaxID=436907 RepID=A7TJQ0_VANPO|nr:uncharacterized protein Kpol_1058p16 [Vanderwaltozyma polyspora DSM 70294]EDO17479.1 hypothetical protein Kpol_1058p16 [Vanderwaltozyma polyspora DSM 70294]
MKLFNTVVVSLILAGTGSCVSSSSSTSRSSSTISATSSGVAILPVNTSVPVAPNYNKLSIEYMGDMILVSQTVVTCNPMFGIINPAVSAAQSTTCFYNGLSCMMNLSAKILEGWDMLDNNNTLKMSVESLFNAYREKNTIEMDLEDSLKLSDKSTMKMNLEMDSNESLIKQMYIKVGTVLLKPLDLKTKIFFKSNDVLERTQERLGCVSFYFGPRAIFSRKEIEIETCLSRYGSRVLMERSKKRTLYRGVRAAYKAFRQMGFLQFLKSPMQLFNQLLHMFRDHLEEGMAKMQRMTEIVTSEEWDGKKVSFTMYDDNYGDDVDPTYRTFLFSVHASKTNGHL